MPRAVRQFNALMIGYDRAPAAGVISESDYVLLTRRLPGVKIATRGVQSACSWSADRFHLLHESQFASAQAWFSSLRPNARREGAFVLAPSTRRTNVQLEAAVEFTRVRYREFRGPGTRCGNPFERGKSPARRCLISRITKPGRPSPGLDDCSTSFRGVSRVPG